MKNWPNNTDFSKPNWTGRVQRVHTQMDGYVKMDDKIPLIAWIGGAVVLMLIFGYVPLMYLFLGN
jgi:hypothetical protein